MGPFRAGPERLQNSVSVFLPPLKRLHPRIVRSTCRLPAANSFDQHTKGN